MREHCHVCNRLCPVNEMHVGEVLVARQTHSSPAEYEDVHICDPCWTDGERDADYERANHRYKETHWNEL